MICTSGLFMFLLRNGNFSDPPLKARTMARRQLSFRTVNAGLMDAPETGQTARARFSLYAMGAGDHMAEIMGCIDFLRQSGSFDRSKNFCTRLKGDAGAVFATLEQASCRFGPPEGHVTLGLTVSANSPSTD